MKRLAVVLLVGALAALILQPVTSTVNTPSGNSGLRADGWPPPPFPPSSDSELRADGWPPPPFPPALGAGGALAGAFLG